MVFRYIRPQRLRSRKQKGIQICFSYHRQFFKIWLDSSCQNLKSSSNKRLFRNCFNKLKKNTKFIRSDRGKEFYKKNFQDFLNKNNIKIYSRNCSYGAVFAERFNHTIRDLLKRLVFEKGDGNWINLLPTITKQHNNRRHSSTKLTPIQASLKKNGGYVYKNILDERKKITPKFHINDLIRTADLKKTFSQGDTNNWFYKMYKITRIINDTIPSNKIDNLPERYNQSSLKKTELTLKENNTVMKNLNLN